MVKRCLLVGGDNRQRIMANLLAEQGITVYCYGMDSCVNLSGQALRTDRIPPTDLVIFPIPLTRDGKTVNARYATRELPLDSILRELHSDATVCGGLMPAAITAELERRGIRYYDYGKSEEFARRNALPSAEGAIEIALRNTPFVLEDARVCVVGYGRIGKVLTKKLKALGCRVTATARKAADLAAIQAAGVMAIPTADLKEQPPFDILFNTVPAPVIDRDVLDAQNPNLLIIDLASPPGGVDFSYAEEKKIRTIHALSLPARCAPVTAARIILDLIHHFTTETEG